MDDKPLIDQEMLDYVGKIAALKGCSLREALRGAIGTEYYLQTKIKEGYNVLIENGKEIREVIFR